MRLPKRFRSFFFLKKKKPRKGMGRRVATIEKLIVVFPIVKSLQLNTLFCEFGAAIAT